MLKRFFTICLTAVLMAASCNKPEPEPTPEPVTDIARGADVSWLTQMEHDGCKFYTSQGKEMECMALLKTLGVNAIRLRVWVNPENGWCGTEDLVAKAIRARSLGLDIMIDFHYSDYWADPGKQNKPAAWAKLNFSDLQNAVYEHTCDVLTALHEAGITPKWIQIGNETTGGMLWPDGQNYTDKGFSQYVQLSNRGYQAAKEIFPNALVIIHVDGGEKADTLDWFFRSCAQHGAQYDMIGLSLYPEASNWRQYVQQITDNINNLYAKYDKECMICEVGMSWQAEQECKDFLSALIANMGSEMHGHCRGVFYWEPEGYESWSHYSKAAFSNNGRPTVALSAFAN